VTSQMPVSGQLPSQQQIRKCQRVLSKQLTVPWAQSLVPRTGRDRFVDLPGVLSQVLGEGCQEKSSASTEADSSLASLGKLSGFAR
jgi:hypothetical protein